MTHMTCTARQAKAPWRPGPCRIATGATALVLAMALPASALAQVYMGHAADGSLVLSDIRSAATPDLWVPGRAPERPEALSIPLPEASATSRRGVARVPGVPGVPERFIAIIQTAARAHGVPAPLIAAVAAAESAFDPRAASTKGARGLMQLMPDTARRFNVQDRLSPEQSVHGGAAYLRWLSDRFDNDLDRVLAAYNAGERHVDRVGGIPPFPETQAYVPRVKAYLQHFGRLWPERGG